MKVIRKFGFLVLLLVATLFIQNASAAVLPHSTHYQGTTYYNIAEDGLSGRIDFAVYDTLGENEFVKVGLPAPGNGRYIYAYQIFNDAGFANETVAGFSISHITSDPLDVDVDSIGSNQDTPDSGIAPTNEYFTSDKLNGVWTFWETGAGTLYAGAHSWFLVLSSNKDWVKGSYDISTTSPESEFPVPVPEPDMLTLLGTGGLLLVSRRRKSV